MKRLALALALPASLALSGCGVADQVAGGIQNTADVLFKTRAQRQAEWEAYLDRKCGKDVACRRHEDHMLAMEDLRRATASR